MGVLVANPITAAREVAPRGGLAGAVGLGVIVPDGGDPLDPDGRWPLGYQLYGPSCGGSSVGSLGVCLPPEGYLGSRDLPSEDQARWQGGPPSAPFRIRTGVRCLLTDLEGDGLADWQAEAARLLDLHAWPQIAHELWTGDQARRDGADNRYLTDGQATELGTGLDIVEAIARVEDALGVQTSGDTAVIHVPVRLVPYLAHAGLISSVTGQTARLFTHNGSLVVADRGYPGTGPGGELPTTTASWIYGTGVLSARVDGQATYPPVRREGDGTATAAVPFSNDAIVRAEKRAAISWLCGHVAAQVTYC